MNLFDNKIRVKAGKLFDVDLNLVKPDEAGSMSELFFKGEQVIRISYSEECNRLINFSAQDGISGVVKCYEYYELGAGEDYDFIDVTLVEKLAPIKKLETIEKIQKICEPIEGWIPDDEAANKAIKLASSLDETLASAIKYTIEYARKVDWAPDFDLSNFMIRPSTGQIVIADPMV